MSIASNGQEADGSSHWPRISADGRFVVFESRAKNLVAGMNSSVHANVFVRDRALGLTERVSLTWDGFEPNADACSPVISSDGRCVAFESRASNLVPNDTNGAADVFLKDRWRGTIEVVSVNSHGEIGNEMSIRPSISGNGRFVAFESGSGNFVVDDLDSRGNVFVRDRWTGETVCVSRDRSGAIRRGWSGAPSISLDGRIVAFASSSKLVPHDKTTYTDIYLYDRLSGKPYLASVTHTGAQANSGSGFPALSGDGRVVTFWSNADNLVPGDTNRTVDVFAHDARTGITEAVGVDEAGMLRERGSEHWTAVSADGRFVAFEARGRMVSYDRNKANDIFIRDRLLRTTVRVSEPSGGGEGDLASTNPALSADGRIVAFASSARNLVPGDTNGFRDVFVHQRGGPSTADRIALSGPAQAAAGGVIDLSWTGADSGSRYWVLAARGLHGTMVGGHFLMLGEPVLVIADGLHGVSGSAVHTTRPILPGWAGQTVYFEIASVSSSGEAHDSNVVAVEIR